MRRRWVRIARAVGVGAEQVAAPAVIAARGRGASRRRPRRGRRRGRASAAGRARSAPARAAATASAGPEIASWLPRETSDTPSSLLDARQIAGRARRTAAAAARCRRTADGAGARRSTWRQHRAQARRLHGPRSAGDAPAAARRPSPRRLLRPRPRRSRTVDDPRRAARRAPRHAPPADRALRPTSWPGVAARPLEQHRHACARARRG